MKKLFLILLLLAICQFTFSYDFKVNGLCYDVISLTNKTCGVTYTSENGQFSGRSMYSGDIIIPRTINYNGSTFTVTHICEYAFEKSTITSVIIGSCVKYIDLHAFYECENLRKVEMPNGVIEIGHLAFYGCENLEYINIPKSIETIGNAVFDGCRKIQSVFRIPKSCNRIGIGALPTMSSIPLTVYIEDSESELFYCEDAIVPYNTKKIYIGRNGSSNYFSTAYYKMMGVYYWKDVTFGDYVTKMPEYYQAIKSRDAEIDVLTIGVSIDSIPELPIYIKNIYMRSSTPPFASGFANKTYVNCTLYIPRGSLSAYKSSAYWNKFFSIKEYDPKPSEFMIEKARIEEARKRVAEEKEKQARILAEKKAEEARKLAEATRAKEIEDSISKAIDKKAESIIKELRAVNNARKKQMKEDIRNKGIYLGIPCVDLGFGVAWATTNYESKNGLDDPGTL